jgi:hypothetical protein
MWNRYHTVLLAGGTAEVKPSRPRPLGLADFDTSMQNDGQRMGTEPIAEAGATEREQGATASFPCSAARL